MEIIAHRGASYDAPENTLAAIGLGWEQGADAVEFDVQFSKDRHLVVIHDDNTRKTARVMKKVRAQTMAQLQALDVGRWKGAKWAGEKMPTLEEALAALPEGKRAFIEIKCGPECIQRLAEAFRQSGRAARQVVVIGFARATMALVKQALPQLEVCWVAEFRRTWRGGWSPAAETLIRRAQEAGLDGLDLSGRGPLNAEFVQKVHRAGLKVYVWTVDAPVQARKLLATGVDGLTTNRPGWLRRQI